MLITINTDERTQTTWWIESKGLRIENSETEPLLSIEPDKIWLSKNPNGYSYLDRRTGHYVGWMGKIDMSKKFEEAKKPRLKF